MPPTVNPIAPVLLPASCDSGEIRCVINDIFSDCITTRVSGTHVLIISGTHMPPGGAVLPEGYERSDDIPKGKWTRTLSFTQVLLSDAPPELSQAFGLPVVTVRLVKQGILGNPLKRKADEITRLTNW